MTIAEVQCSCRVIVADLGT